MSAREIARRIVAHYRRAGRDLPFRRTRDPYAIWVSEVMAQQTRIETLIPYWERWMARFPDPRALAAAPLDEVLARWAGLGYYARARNLHRAAAAVVARHGGEVPEDVVALRALPGVGRYTAGAIASIAFGKREAVVDGNVLRVYARLLGIEGDVRREATRRKVWAIAEGLVPAEAPGEFNQGLMELGATICTPRAPRCEACPVARSCVARRSGRVHELPVVGKRGATRRVVVDAAWIVRRGKVLLGRRAAAGLFGGLWELPELGSLSRDATLERGRRPLAQHVHQLSHRRIRYRVFAAAASGPIRLGAPYDAARWTSLTAAMRLGVSSATRSLLDSLRESSWPTRKAR